MRLLIRNFNLYHIFWHSGLAYTFIDIALWLYRRLLSLQQGNSTLLGVISHEQLDDGWAHVIPDCDRVPDPSLQQQDVNA